MISVEDLLAKLNGARKRGKGWIACCPVHDDKTPSLSIGVGNDGRILLKCHAGCKFAKICAAIGIDPSELFPPKDLPKRKIAMRTIVKTYDYQDENGQFLFQVVRYDPKDFRQRTRTADGDWSWSVTGIRQVPYRLPELLRNPVAIVFVVEGEKDVNNLRRLGEVATCNAGGAGKWYADHATHLHGRSVVVLPDNDDAGTKHAALVARSLRGIAASVRVVNLPGLPPKGDVSDWLAAGGTLDELHRLVNAVDEWTDADDCWPTIDRLDEVTLPSFPIHALPAPLARFVEAESIAMQTPADLAGLLALAACSALIARRVTIAPREGWTEPTNLFVAVLLGPGNRKSPVFNDVLVPLRKLESMKVEAAKSEVARMASERRQDENRLRKLEKEAAERGDAAMREQAIELAQLLASTSTPVLPRLLIDDATPEKVGIMLHEQGGRIASMSAEGGVFDLMAGAYSKNSMPNFNVYLIGHAGDDLVTDRVGRESVHVPCAAITCAYAIQPIVIQGLAAHPAFRGRGMLARFLFATPKSWIGTRQIAAPPVSTSIRDTYNEAVMKLDDLPDGTILSLSPNSQACLQAWETEVEAILGDGGDMELMRDWGSKLVGETLRIAGVMHCVGGNLNDEIEIDTLRNAIEIARYLIPHAERVLLMMNATDDGAEADAEYVLRWIERHGLREFTKTQAQHDGKRRFPRSTDIDPALGELVRRGYIRKCEASSDGPGRPPSDRFEVNPTAFDRSSVKSCSRYSQKETCRPSELNSGNIGSALSSDHDEFPAPKLDIMTSIE